MRQDGHTIPTDAGSIRIEGEALAGIIVTAAELVDGARARRPKRGVEVVVANGRIRVDLEVAARYGAVLPELGEAVQRRVTEALELSSGLNVAAVDVSIAELEHSH